MTTTLPGPACLAHQAFRGVPPVVSGGSARCGVPRPWARLADQYDLVREHHAFTDAELAELARQSVRGS
ncbi:hypothetical protein ABZ401_16415, partial [Streptomyces sp. NPDC005892]|uniref:hypothetical protein n=1 Tax=Streptomyces sp. NPDC005892 TaxID=3155593 RepID=UPI0033D9F514